MTENTRLQARRWFLVFLQHLCVGLVTRTIAEGVWVVVFLVAYLQQLIWWANMGTRIDLHASRGAPYLYALISAAGIVIGAMLWR